MRVSTGKGDSGYTGLLGGERVSKDHTVIETEGALDEANSHIGLARATSRIRRTKRILLVVQKHLFKIGAELSTLETRSQPLKKGLSEIHVTWLDGLVDHYEGALRLSPGFVAFGQQESPSHMDVARTSVRKVERMVVKMRREGVEVNPLVLKYLNRLSDLLFLLACLEEKKDQRRHRLSPASVFKALGRHDLRWWLTLISGVVLILASAVLLLLLIRANRPVSGPQPIQEHREEMGPMHDPSAGQSDGSGTFLEGTMVSCLQKVAKRKLRLGNDILLDVSFRPNPDKTSFGFSKC